SGPAPDRYSRTCQSLIKLNKQRARAVTQTNMSCKQRKATASSSLLSLASNDVSEMLLPPFLCDDNGAKPDLVEHSFRLKRHSDHSSQYNLKIKWYEQRASKAEFSHDINMSIGDIHKSRHAARSSSLPPKSKRASKPEPEYISINDSQSSTEKRGYPKIVARAVAQLRRNGNIVHMLFRDEHSLSATIRDIVNTVIQQLDAEGTSPDVYLLSTNLTKPNTTLQYHSLPNWRLSDMAADPAKEVHVAIDFSHELAKLK
ncbi:hypothetical protein PFISCL1PPCAC_18327, partial [Pristionchus fissidentatus]